MAYTRKGSRFSGRGRRASAAKTIQSAARKRAFTKARGGLKTVARVQRAPYVPQRVKNTASIATLSRVVNRLNKERLGLYQKRTEGVILAGSPWNYQRPYAFCLNQFIGEGGTGINADKTPIYHVDAQGTVAPYQYVTRHDDHFGQHDAFPGAVNDIFNPHWSNRSETVSQTVYQPVYTKVMFEFSASLKSTDQPVWIRLDFVKPKKILPKSAQHMLMMPDGLPQFTQLADDAIHDRNTVNTTYWSHVVKTKWIKLNNSDTGASTNEKVITKRCSIKMSFPKKYLKTDFDTHLDSHTQLAEAKFHEQVNPKDLYWCIMSRNIANNKVVVTNILRDIGWRDQHGTTA